MEPMRIGVYEHYKGGFYQLITVAESSDNTVPDGQMMVVYCCLYTSKGGPYNRVRSMKEFNQLVKWADGEERPRFRYRGIDPPM